MRLHLPLVLVVAILQGAQAQHPVPSGQWSAVEKELARFINKAESELQESAVKHVFIEWAYATNINPDTEAKKKEYQKVSDALYLRIGKEAKAFNENEIHDIDLKRKLKKLSDIGSAVLPKAKLDRYNHVTNKMEKIYSVATVPDYKDSSMMHNYEPGLVTKLAESRDPKELEHYWDAWRRVTGREMRDLYLEYIDLTNEYARLNGYRDGTESKTQAYESDTFVEEMAETWRGLKPLYEEMHAYARHKLIKLYGEDVIPRDGPIPAHLLGNMWAQSWNNLADVLKPYPNKPNLDTTDEMVRQGWTPKIMFEKADEFFQSLGLDPMPKEFWEGSLIERPDDGRDLVCHASAWDFYNGKDFRIKQCTRVNHEDFITVNHEMGHTQYQMSYRNLSFLYREGANPGFHEGVADILSLAVSTAGYFQHLGLVSKDVDVTDYETDINILFDTALQRIVFMPFGYLVDKYRWDLFSGYADEKDMNCHWVKLRMDIQGVSPPNQRSEEDFDAGSKYHVAANVGYVRYFTAYIYQFQFYKALCKASGHYVPGDPDKPLHRCNFFGSKKAGSMLYEMLKLGASKPWKEVIEVLTGQPRMDTSAYREYFKPLEDWLRKTNRANGVHVGWKVDDFYKYCKSGPTGGSTAMRTNSGPTVILCSAAMFMALRNMF